MVADKPKLLVFDLDYTLWPFWVDTHVSPPFRKGSNGMIIDSNKEEIKCYPEVPEMLKSLHEEGYTLAIASRTSEIKGAKQLIQLFGWDKYFTYLEIFPGCKITHFKSIKSHSQMDYNEMVFFDDEQRNITDVGGLGVVSVFVKGGVSKSVIEEGMQMFKNRNKH